jgi:hypothetical protein
VLGGRDRRKLRLCQSMRLAPSHRPERVAIQSTALVGQPISRRAAHVILAGDDAPAAIRDVARRRSISGERWA